MLRLKAILTLFLNLLYQKLLKPSSLYSISIFLMKYLKKNKLLSQNQ